MRFVVDTHVLIWFSLGSRKLWKEHATLLRRCEQKREPVGVAAITAFELAQLAAAGKLDTKAETFFELIEGTRFCEWLPLTPEIALDATRLGASFHRDPADQLIAATARIHGLTLVTADERIRASGVVAVV